MLWMYVERVRVNVLSSNSSQGHVRNWAFKHKNETMNLCVRILVVWRCVCIFHVVNVCWVQNQTRVMLGSEPSNTEMKLWISMYVFLVVWRCVFFFMLWMYVERVYMKLLRSKLNQGHVGIWAFKHRKETKNLCVRILVVCIFHVVNVCWACMCESVEFIFKSGSC